MLEEGLDVPACLARVREGDEDAARALLNHLYPLVMKIVRSHLPRRTGEEDLAQMVFMKIFTKIDQYSGAAPLEHWVSRIAVNTCLNQIASESLRPELRWADLSEEQELVMQSLASAAEDFQTSTASAARELLEKVMALLSPADRLVINLVHLEVKSVEEISRMTGWSRALVKVRAFRARKKIRAHLENLWKENNS
jgi:RNA polymerase sigma factor (sigma-70 family)